MYVNLETPVDTSNRRSSLEDLHNVRQNRPSSNSSKCTEVSRKSGYLSNKSEKKRINKNTSSMFIRNYLFGPTTSIIFGASIGIGLGLLLSKVNISSDGAEWISLPGDLFIRALKCLVIPFIFSSLTTGIADIVSVGKASKIARKMMFFFVTTTTWAAASGVVWARLIFHDVFRSSKANINATNSTSKNAPIFNLLCNNGKYIEQINNTGLACTGTSPDYNVSKFLLQDINSYFEVSTNVSSSRETLSEELINFIENLFPENITNAFASSSLLGIISFSILFGIALKQTQDKKNKNMKFDNPSLSTDLIIELLRQFNEILGHLVKLVIKLTPIAVVSLIAGSFATNQIDKSDAFTQVGYLVLNLLFGSLIHIYMSLPLFFFIFIRKNPYIYLSKMVPAQIFSFGCASSLATLPVTLRCVKRTNQIARHISRFVIVLGTPLNMNGTALYFPLAINFLVQTSGLSGQMTDDQWILLIFISAITALGGAPVPNGGIVMILTVWKTIFSEEIPASFSFLVAVDWILDRLRTATNVSGNTMVVRMVAENL